MCGIVGMISASDERVIDSLYPSLWALNHRGKESAGGVTWDGTYHSERKMGIVETTFRNLSKLPGSSGIGQVRYSTTGRSSRNNIQPICGTWQKEEFAVGHNGNFTGYRFSETDPWVGYSAVRRAMEDLGYKFHGQTDTEIFTALIHFSPMKTFEESIIWALERVRGAYSLVVLRQNKVYGIRDPNGFRPLEVGRSGDLIVIASETCALDVIDVPFIRSVQPGEVVLLDQNANNWCTIRQSPADERFCVFEYVYFARPDSKIHDVRILAVRREMGRRLWEESSVEADVVVGIPDSANYAAAGLAEASRLPVVTGFFRPHNVSRTFTEPLQRKRVRQLKIKLNVIREEVAGKRVVVVDDSIVRSTVIRRAVRWLISAGAREVHVRITSPPYMHPCHYGIDTYRVKNELIAPRFHGEIEAIRRYIGATSLAYLSLEGMVSAIHTTRTSALGEERARSGKPRFCTACFTGEYPVSIAQ